MFDSINPGQPAPPSMDDITAAHQEDAMATSRKRKHPDPKSGKKQSHLETAQFEIRTLTEKDLANYRLLFNDGTALKKYGYQKPTPNKLESNLAKWTEQSKHHLPWVYAVYSRHSSTFAGHAMLEEFNEPRSLDAPENYTPPPSIRFSCLLKDNYQAEDVSEITDAVCADYARHNNNLDPTTTSARKPVKFFIKYGDTFILSAYQHAGITCSSAERSIQSCSLAHKSSGYIFHHPQQEGDPRRSTGNLLAEKMQIYADRRLAIIARNQAAGTQL
ncbi:hypothetical protein FNU76_06595 [Chitinimonas arctica]|uniref:Uncharacterized protein n=1 Tax=Chitinimonas arctica TaxID=2594795 RepID=A0A516SD09_9NEIS|nr:hypothetical protein [Chitinimonas arctica]QDQ26042.1 hypothetical protein FNU76_06595 [Chitinimonas arctica]